MSEEMLPGKQFKSLIEKDMQDCYLRYSMSVIVARALPDARDGFKPVHRRVMYSMHKLGVVPNKPTVKSARIVGDVIGKYHPHGDSAVYETLVRMAQEFSLRYPLVFGQGNFGSIDGDGAAAMRYTEAKMNNLGMLMLEDLEKDTVDMGPNYDESLEEPKVLPSAIPNMLVNGTTGIAVGMATSMAPHNLREIANAIHAVAENPDISGEDLLGYVSGPDFPTGGVICGRAGIRDAYLTGHGRARVRARTEIDVDGRGKPRIIVSEIPYMVNKAELCKKIGELVREKRIDGITDIRDESNREGIRVVIELRKDAVAEVVLNNLFKNTQMQTTFSIYNLALVNGLPKVLTLKDLIQIYIDHRLDVITRATQFDLNKAEARLHIIEGLRIATQNIDEVVQIIKSSATTELAKKGLQERFNLDEIQSQAIVDMRLAQLTGLNLEKLENEYNELVALVADLKDILAKRERRLAIVLEKLDAVVAKFGDERRTSIEDAVDDYDYEDLIAEEEQVITLSKEGYIKRLPIDTFKAQTRGGKGVVGTGLKDDDDVDQIFTASTHSYLLVFTNKGRAYWTKVYRLPEGNRNSKGRPIINFIGLTEGEKVQAIVPVRKFGGYFCLVFATKKGIVNKMDLTLFSRPRKAGVNAISLDEDDELVKVQLVGMSAEEFNASQAGDENDESAEVQAAESQTAAESEDSDETADQPIAKDLLMIATKMGQAVTFPISCMRSMGRGTHGVKGITLAEGDEVISLIWLKEGNKIVTITEKGFGKRSLPSSYRVTKRGSKGVRNLSADGMEKTGPAVFVESVADDYDLIITSKEGQVIRIEAETIRLTNRSAIGVKCIRLNDGDTVQDATALPSVEDIEHDSAEAKETFDHVEGVEVDDDSVEKSSETEQQIGLSSEGGDNE
ncbi:MULTISPECIES: DNA gyrase subunit A [unclassified Fibrobacter]|uniref:DNA gyrase subunit A n=1 Tax=unclassified Fibrobacter TaxID=2634177 RepID=UPI000D6BA272|nr:MULTISPECIES: DNA gyrase subunit A [unclassified Fibrobacter]PWJ71656.1 DNA gyrase subunit A [Fibrobacter sp. UWR4]PZW65100.1 DNA gyrase subunit A [Fibrobacter sp. UWR1]